jgi:leader peptidase (prepilin peptidase)/N-methyltransferase
MLMVYIIISFVVGACMGSFAGAQVWRVRAKQLLNDKKSGHKVDSVEYTLSKLNNKTFFNDRSIDLETGRRLKWFELIPIISWLILRGKSRYSKKPIGYFELLVEIIMGLLFATTFAVFYQNFGSSHQLISILILLVAFVLLAIIFAYDMKWSLIPSYINYALIALGVINFIVEIIFSSNISNTVISTLSGAFILSGIYFIICTISKEKLIGFGDVELGLALALLLADWRLAFLDLFFANLLGSIISIPLMACKKINRKSQIPFAPFLIFGFIFAKLFGLYVIHFYLSFFI